MADLRPFHQEGKGEVAVFEFRYKVSLHISHPNLDPDKVSEELGFRPVASHKVGAPRRSPAGSPLSGCYKESYWYCDLPQAENADLSEFLQDAAQRLESHRDFLIQIRDTGGSSELWVCWYNEINSTDRLSWSLLRLLSELRLDLRIDVYAEENDEKPTDSSQEVNG